MAPDSDSPMSSSSVAPTSLPPRPPTAGGSSLYRALSLVALAIAASALVVSFVLPGPTGAVGPQGPGGAKGSTGPQGNGTLVAVSHTSATTQFSATGCTPYARGNVTITVPSSGVVVVQAQVWVILHHDTSNTTTAYLGVSSTNTTCQTGAYGWPIEMLPGDPTGWTNFGTFPQNTFSVTAGVYTFFITGEVTGGWWPSNDVFWYANIVAVFYPS